MAGKTVSATITPEVEIRSFTANFSTEVQKLFRSVRSALRKRVPTANELVYVYNAIFVVGYSATEQGVDGLLSIWLRADEVRLYFGHGKKLPDPKKLLMGAGTTTRFIPIESAKRLKHPDVEALISAEIAHSIVPLPAKGRGKVIIRSVLGKKPPRKKSKK
jgi:hypothetical protein